MAISAKDFEEGRQAFASELARRGRGAGPRYCGEGAGSATAWYDQYFGRDFEPAGTVNCPQALRVGSTQAALDVVVKASVGNESELLIPAGSTMTMRFMQGESEKGIFEDVGPSVCIKAPASGLAVEPGMVAFRFPAGNFTKPWLMVSVEFSGAISGGKVDCCLGYVPR